jgi:hypothetical protein
MRKQIGIEGVSVQEVIQDLPEIGFVLVKHLLRLVQ